MKKIVTVLIVIISAALLCGKSSEKLSTLLRLKLRLSSSMRSWRSSSPISGPRDWKRARARKVSSLSFIPGAARSPATSAPPLKNDIRI